MPKFKVYLQQYVETIATLEVEAETEEEARATARRDSYLAEWQPGEDAYAVDVYAVRDGNDDLVWER